MIERECLRREIYESYALFLEQFNSEETLSEEAFDNLKSKIHDFLQGMTDIMHQCVKKLGLSPDKQLMLINQMPIQAENNSRVTD